MVTTIWRTSRFARPHTPHPAFTDEQIDAIIRTVGRALCRDRGRVCPTSKSMSFSRPEIKPLAVESEWMIDMRCLACGAEMHLIEAARQTKP